MPHSRQRVSPAAAGVPHSGQASARRRGRRGGGPVRDAALGFALTPRGVALGGFDRVAEQHGDRGGPDPADPRGDRAGHLLAPLVDVGEELAALVADAAADHDRARA